MPLYEEIKPTPGSLEHAGPKETADMIIRLLDSKKAKDIKLLYVEKQTIIADYFVICTGTSNTQIRSLADEVRFKMSMGGREALRVEGADTGSWVLLDYGSVIAHIFNPEARNLYKLDKLWTDAVEVDISALLVQ
jgi:ribosome-associated protein